QRCSFADDCAVSWGAARVSRLLLTTGPPPAGSCGAAGGRRTRAGSRAGPVGGVGHVSLLTGLMTVSGAHLTGKRPAPPALPGRIGAQTGPGVGWPPDVAALAGKRRWQGNRDGEMARRARSGYLICALSDHARPVRGAAGAGGDGGGGVGRDGLRVRAGP